MALSRQLKIAEENLQVMVNNSQNRLNQLVSASTDVVKDFFNEQSEAFKKLQKIIGKLYLKIVLSLENKLINLIVLFKK